MMPSFPVGFLLLLDVIALSLLAVALPPFAQPRRKGAVVGVAALVPLAALVTFVIAKGFHAVGVGRVAGATAWLSMTLVFLAGLFGLVGRALATLAALVKPGAKQEKPADPSRRRFLRAVPQGATALGAAVAAGGIATGQRAPQLRRVELFYPDLDPALEGFTILQFSDLHLGVSLGLDDLDAALLQAAAEKPDLVVITGDVVDDRPLFDRAIPKIAALAPPAGVFACLGNHEYLRRIGLDPAQWKRLGVTLLRDEATTIACGKGGRATLGIAGVDDPMELRSEPVQRGIAASLRRISKPTSTFALLLSHRPEAFLVEGMRDYDLVLSGHTHGGQWGLFGRSLLDAVTGRAIHWGSYAKSVLVPGTTDGRTKRVQLFTTSGFGDWFPFRVACPRELPLLILRRG